jgi:HK97 family phage major capsid protein
VSDENNTVEELVKDISDRLESIGQASSAENVRAMVKESFEGLLNDQEFARKMKFGKTDNELVGSKFARHNLNSADIEFAYDLLTARSRNGVGAGPSEELSKAFKAVSDAYYMDEAEVRAIDRQAIDDVFPRVPKTRAQAIARAEAIRAMDTAESGYGSQLVGAQYVGDLFEAARAESRVFGLLDTFEMSAPTAYLPVEVDVPELLLVSESTANNSSNYTTSKTGSNRLTVTAKKFVIHQMWSGEMEEDSILPFVPFLRRQAGLALAHYSDSAVLNGDTTNASTGNINLDDADPADTKHYLAFDGIRHAALVDNTGNADDAAGAVTLALLRDLRGLMIDSTNIVDWGHPTDPNDLVYVADPATADRIATIDEVIKAKQMLGANAGLLNGEVGRIIGHPVISSMAVSKTEADGKVSTTAANNTLGQVVAFNRRAFKVGFRRRVRIETERMPATDQNRIVYSVRMGLGRFSATGAASGIEAAAVLYNISL